MALVELLGEKVIKKDKSEVSVDSLAGEGKVVGLYFSAHWCPPCRGFTPKLADWYREFKKSANGDKLEIIFVSSDRDEKSFQEYFNEMPWLALGYSDRTLKNTLSKKFKVSGIPTLIFLDAATASVNEADGRSVVMEDTKGENFPWTPKTFAEIFTGDLINNQGDKLTTDDVKGKVLGLYFSAHWCGPCRGFTPNLVKAYKTMIHNKKNLEIVFCSSDRDEDSFKEYFKDMPWLALPFSDKRKTALSRRFEVQGIPTLVFLDEEWNLITTNGRGAVTNDLTGEDFPFYPKPVNMLSGESAGPLNDKAALVWFADSSDRVTAFMDLLTPIAKDVIDKAKAAKSSSVLDFFVASQDDDDDDVIEGMADFCKLDPSKAPFLSIIDIPSQAIYKDYDKKEYTADELKTLVNKYIEGKLEMQKLR